MGHKYPAKNALAYAPFLCAPGGGLRASSKHEEDLRFFGENVVLGSSGAFLSRTVQKAHPKIIPKSSVYHPKIIEK